MLEVHATSDTAEDRAANYLAQMIIDADPQTKTSGEVHICIISNLQCYGQSPQDIDLVLLIVDRRTKPFSGADGTLLRGCCVTIEVKAHSPSGIAFEGAGCIVKYNGDDHNVSVQSENQKYSLKKYVERNSPNRAPFINNVIWLRGLPASLLPKVSSNLLASNSTWQDFVDKILSLSKPENGEVKKIRNSRQFFDLVKILCKRMEPGSLDRKKMEIVAKRVTQSDRQYLSRLGEQLLIFRGRGGTGKTIRLLQLGHHLYHEMGARVLLLTYNTALAADISRLLSLLGIQDGIGEKAIGVRTVHKLMRDWLVSLELFEQGERDFIGEYEELKKELLDFLRVGALDSADVSARKSADSCNLAWDFVLIDECQDWPANERDIIYQLYGHKSCVLADGVDQLVRNERATDWRESMDPRDSQIVTLRKSLRLKAGLCDFVSELAQTLNVPNWDLQPEPDIYGGKVIVLAGADYDRKFHDDLTAAALKSGNCVIDLLHCVPPSNVDTDDKGERVSRLARQLSEWSCEVWDGASASVRSSFPTSTNQHRIVQYDSCRGLEGWAVVCHSIDKFYDYKLERYDSALDDLFIDPIAQTMAFASRWVMIPLTRAIDTLVLHVEDVDHPFARALKTASDLHPETVEWKS